VSCSSSKRIIGNYYVAGKDFNKSLILKKDSSFFYTQNVFEGQSKCQGRWKYLSKDTLLLKCDTEKSVEAMLQSGYISERTQKAIILSHNRIKLKNVILQKVK
jgi:hypothetical protein